MKRQIVYITSKDKENKYYKLLQTLSEENMLDMAKVFADQLSKDMYAVEKNENITECGIFSPRKNSVYDCKFTIEET